MLSKFSAMGTIATLTVALVIVCQSRSDRGLDDPAAKVIATLAVQFRDKRRACAVKLVMPGTVKTGRVYMPMVHPEARVREIGSVRVGRNEAMRDGALVPGQEGASCARQHARHRYILRRYAGIRRQVRLWVRECRVSFCLGRAAGQTLKADERGSGVAAGSDAEKTAGSRFARRRECCTYPRRRAPESLCPGCRAGSGSGFVVTSPLVCVGR